MSEIFIYDGSFCGFLTAVFAAYAKKTVPEAIVTENNVQLTIGAKLFNVETDEEKADRVAAALCKILGKIGFFRIYKAFLSDEDGREKIIFDYLRLVFSFGKNAAINYADKRVTDVYFLSRKTGNEAHLMKGFLRLRETEKNIYYAEFSPKTNCIELVAPHFKNRLSGMEFVINDVKRKRAAYWDKAKLDIFCYEAFEAPKETENERDFKKMWCEFYKKVSIEERKNERCRMTNMPKRFWRYMCETEEMIKNNN